MVIWSIHKLKAIHDYVVTVSNHGYKFLWLFILIVVSDSLLGLNWFVRVAAVQSTSVSEKVLEWWWLKLTRRIRLISWTLMTDWFCSQRSCIPVVESLLVFQWLAFGVAWSSRKSLVVAGQLELPIWEEQCGGSLRAGIRPVQVVCLICPSCISNMKSCIQNYLPQKPWMAESATSSWMKVISVCR